MSSAGREGRQQREMREIELADSCYTCSNATTPSMCAAVPRRRDRRRDR